MTEFLTLELRKEEEGKKVPTEFVKIITSQHVIPTKTKPMGYDVVVLIEKNYDNEFDLMYATYSGKDMCGVAYLGHWNDGV